MSENGGTLTVYQRMSDPLQAVNELGTAIAKSGMFGCGSIEQGKVLALECLARGMPPLTLAERYHVVQGKLMMKYDAMLAEFHGMGGKHKIISRTEDKAEIELTIDGQTIRESLTWEQAEKEKWPFKSDGKSLKDNWATPRARRQMLWARVVSEGVRALCPEVNNGRYVAEEIEDEIAAVAQATAGNGQHKSQTASVVEQAKSASKAPAPADVVDAEFERKAEQPQQTASVDEFATPAQRLTIERLFDQCSMSPEGRLKSLANRKCNTLGMRDLTAAGAVDLIAALEKKLASIKAAHEASLPELTPGSDPAGAACGPCTPQQEQAIKKAFEEWKQIDPKTSGEQFKLFVAKLRESGRQKILDLSANDAARLYNAVQNRKLDSFFRLNLEAWRPVEQQNQPAAT